MAVTYESRHAGTMVLIVDKESKRTVGIPFDKQSKFLFGRLTVDKALAESRGLKEKDIIAAIEAGELFKNRVPGESGIWRQDERGTVKVQADVPKILDALRLWTPDQLKAKLTEAQVEYPPTASQEQLAQLVYENIPAGRLNLANVKVVAPAPEVPAHVKPGGMRRGVQTAD